MEVRKKLVQRSLFDDSLPEDRVVNVSSVPQRSLFRYPGGKTWLVPRIRQWLQSMESSPELFVEPFAGGGIVGLTVAFEELAGKVLMVELDEDVSSVWETILGDDGEWLADRILRFELTEDSARQVVADSPSTTRDRAFKTIVRNRTLHGGILAPGSRFIRSGEAGKGITSRWYPDTLARRIRDIAAIRERIEFRRGDGIMSMTEYAKRPRAAFFIDPPYTAGGKKAGNRLYAHHSLDHELLFSTAEKLKGDFLMTYDNASEIEALAKRHGFTTRAVAMKNTHHAVMNELMIARNLDWLG